MNRPEKIITAENCDADAPAVHNAHRFSSGDFIVYPAHGVGQIVGVEEQEIAGARLELFVIDFVKDKMMLRVPTAKAVRVGMRKLSDASTITQAEQRLTQRPHICQRHLVSCCAGIRR